MAVNSVGQSEKAVLEQKAVARRFLASSNMLLVGFFFERVAVVLAERGDDPFRH
jgi:hypothetical protein